MKTIGIIGGVTWKSSLEYYRLMNEITKVKLGGLHSCKIIMYSVDFYEIEKLQRGGEWDKVAERIIGIMKKLENAGAELLVIASNTIHIIAEDVEKNSKIPFLHIIDPTAKEISRRGIRKVGLLGTKATMEENFYKERLKKKFDIETIIPSEYDREVLQHIIFNELAVGIINEISRRRLKRIIENLMMKGIEGIILGCTELPLLVNEKEDTFLFNSTLLHAKAAVEMALEEQ
ncbi:aspartate racemase [Natronincola peptidivorans]|uniref:Aspartate racemase n=1 Tax=Natronincola peptidivorans TaxID=426128 RepID=A0A1I0BXI5_9FIRM|nr:aspartate/glutamate racemase family protein [Natronincola peptidivorans]SET11092.1 aspartate racemase [Natronincola peptidivorans]